MQYMVTDKMKFLMLFVWTGTLLTVTFWLYSTNNNYDMRE